MKTVPASKFKAQALGLLDEVAKTGEELIVTKRGKPVARVLPVSPPQDVRPGWLSDTLVGMGDLISPVAEEEWEAAR